MRAILETRITTVAVTSQISPTAQARVALERPACTRHPSTGYTTTTLATSTTKILSVITIIILTTAPISIMIPFTITHTITVVYSVLISGRTGVGTESISICRLSYSSTADISWLGGVMVTTVGAHEDAEVVISKKRKDQT